MYFRFVVAAIFLVSLAIAGNVRPESPCNPDKCRGKNEVYSTCGSCDKNCPGIPDPKDCKTKDCKVGCFCAPGYYRNCKKQCVKCEQCSENGCSKVKG